MQARLTMVYWRGNHFFLGKVLEHPEIMTQGETLKELEENLKDAYLAMALDDVPDHYANERSCFVKRMELIRQLEQQGCRLHRHGSRHDIDVNPTNGQKQPVPRHSETDDALAKHI